MTASDLYRVYVTSGTFTQPASLSARLRLIADWLDLCDQAVGEQIGNPELPSFQDDLREAAAVLDMGD